MLENLEIKNFRTFSHLRIERLARVNLVVGKNNVGKTTLLEALRFYETGSATTLRECLAEHDELFVGGSLREPLLDLRALFHGRPAGAAEIEIGTMNGQGQRLSVKLINLLREEESDGFHYYEVDEDAREEESGTEVEGELFKAVVIERKDGRVLVKPQPPRSLLSRAKYFGPAYIGPRGVAESDLTFWWETIALTSSEERVVDALALFAQVERIASVEDPLSGAELAAGVRSGRRVFKVRMKGCETPVPLESLGDGMARVFQLAVAAEYASHESGKSETAEPESQEPRETNNLLLIDEIENGIHHTVQVELWRRLFQLARQHNLQVVATTHSEDCLRGFAQALAEQEEDDGLAIRLEKVEGEEQTGAVIIDRDDLPIVIRDSIEVR